MKSQILVDGAAAPHLFLWNGPVGRQHILDWIAERHWVISPDLVEFWAATGGGEILESERLLRPLLEPQGQEEVAQVTAWCQQRGMASGLVVFHEGLGFTAVRGGDGVYIWLDGDLRIISEHSTLNQWYVETLRNEYGDRYGLGGLASNYKP